MAKRNKVKLKVAKDMSNYIEAKEGEVKFCKCGMWLPEGRMCNICGDINLKSDYNGEEDLYSR